MICSEIREFVFAFLDNELDAALSIEFQRHLDRCHGCAREVEIERSIKGVLAHHLEREAGESGIDEGILRLVTSDKRRNVPSPWASRRWLLAASISIIAISAAAFYGVLRSEHTPSSNRFVQLVAADFAHFVDEGGVVQVESGDAEIVSSWLHDKTGINATLPTFRDGSWELIGGRKCKIDKKPAAFAVYRHGSELVSLLAMSAEQTTLKDMKRVERSERGVWLGTTEGYSVVALRHDSLIYAAVSQGGTDELTDLILGVVNESN